VFGAFTQNGIKIWADERTQITESAAHQKTHKAIACGSIQ